MMVDYHITTRAETKCFIWGKTPNSMDLEFFIIDAPCKSTLFL
jgi:hypothetical protein